MPVIHWWPLAAFVGGLIFAWLASRVVTWIQRRNVRRYPNPLAHYAESKVREAGYGRDMLGRPKHARDGDQSIPFHGSQDAEDKFS